MPQKVSERCTQCRDCAIDSNELINCDIIEVSNVITIPYSLSSLEFTEHHVRQSKITDRLVMFCLLPKDIVPETLTNIVRTLELLSRDHVRYYKKLIERK